MHYYLAVLDFISHSECILIYQIRMYGVYSSKFTLKFVLCTYGLHYRIICIASFCSFNNKIIKKLSVFLFYVHEDTKTTRI